jgi:DNA replication protein DnaC
MEQNIDSYLQYIGLVQLRQNWDAYLKDATQRKLSYQRFLSTIITEEYYHHREMRRLARLKAAAIPELLVMETFPFQRQPHLKKKLVMELYDSLRFMSENQFLLFIGPTGCGKTGLATSYLVHAINNHHRSRFIDFKELIDKLYRSVADHTEKRVIRHFAAIDCLLIDEIGYSSLNKEQAALFFELMKQRHRKRCTIMTSQLGFDEWGAFINNAHLTAALLDRITENCTVFNMNRCISIRKKRITYAAEKNQTA